MKNSNQGKAISLFNITKCYKLYERPLDRLRQVFPLLGKNQCKEFRALYDISFEVEKGDVMGIVGRNGAGKSTLLQIICGTLTPTSGQISVNGRIAALLELGSGFNPEFTGRENIYLNASVLGMTRDEIDHRVDDIIEFAEISDFIEQPVKFYSSGMSVRLAFSIATSVSPEILVIDEALSVGDNEFSHKSFCRIEELRTAGVTILFCSHSLYQVQAICNKAVWIEKGRIQEIGDPDYVTTCYRDNQSKEGNKFSTNNDILTSGRKVEIKTVKKDKNQEKTGHITSTEITVNGNAYSKGLPINSLNDNLKIKVFYKIEKNLNIPSVAVSLSNKSSQIICGVGSANDEITGMVNKEGEGYYELEFPKIKLLKGYYEVNIVLFCEKGIHVIDHATCIEEIYVVQSGLEQGYVHLEHTWKSGCQP